MRPAVRARSGRRPGFGRAPTRRRGCAGAPATSRGGRGAGAGPETRRGERGLVGRRTSFGCPEGRTDVRAARWVPPGGVVDFVPDFVPTTAFGRGAPACVTGVGVMSS